MDTTNQLAEALRRAKRLIPVASDAWEMADEALAAYEAAARDSLTTGGPLIDEDTMLPLPQGYEPHEVPSDYTGPLFIEGQMRRYAKAVALDERQWILAGVQLQLREIERLRTQANMLLESSFYYEDALFAAFPEGAQGRVFEAWNAARQVWPEALNYARTSARTSARGQPVHEESTRTENVSKSSSEIDMPPPQLVEALRTGLEVAMELLAMKGEALGADSPRVQTYKDAVAELRAALAQQMNPNSADDQEFLSYIVNAARAIEAAHGIKGQANAGEVG